jgi:hypothetical protein
MLFSQAINQILREGRRIIVCAHKHDKSLV